MTPSVCAWRDDFDGAALDERWYFMHEDPTHWSLAARPGYLRITTQEADIFGDTNEALNMIVGWGPEGDFEISTHVQLAPTQPRQQAALMMFGDVDNYVQVARIFDNIGGNRVQMVVEVHGLPVALSTPCNLSDLYLKLSKAGTDFRSYYSADGTNWTLVSELDHPLLEYAQFGLSAWNGSPSSAAEIPADFDWFCLKE